MKKNKLKKLLEIIKKIISESLDAYYQINKEQSFMNKGGSNKNN